MMCPFSSAAADNRTWVSSGTGAGRDVIENALRSRDTRDRLCVSIELLDTELTRLRTEALLADFGG